VHLIAGEVLLLTDEEYGMQRKGNAVWTGGLRDGKGTISTASGVLNNTQYSFATRFENGTGTNPEELIGAAHAGCFSMAFSAALEKEGFKADRVATEAAVSLEKVADGFAITAVHLTVTGKVSGIDEAKFQQLAAGAKAGCPVSKVLNAKITMDAKLES
jgi:lipoyl-dependent peroxiredoxin